eukprot:916344-Rhodomonas_salina.1
MRGTRIQVGQYKTSEWIRIGQYKARYQDTCRVQYLDHARERLSVFSRVVAVVDQTPTLGYLAFGGKALVR